MARARKPGKLYKSRKDFLVFMILPYPSSETVSIFKEHLFIFIKCLYLSQCTKMSEDPFKKPAVRNAQIASMVEGGLVAILYVTLTTPGTSRVISRAI